MAVSIRRRPPVLPTPAAAEAAEVEGRGLRTTRGTGTVPRRIRIRDGWAGWTALWWRAPSRIGIRTFVIFRMRSRFSIISFLRRRLRRPGWLVGCGTLWCWQRIIDGSIAFFAGENADREPCVEYIAKRGLCHCGENDHGSTLRIHQWRGFQPSSMYILVPKV